MSVNENPSWPIERLSHIIVPQWDAPSNVRAFTTTRLTQVDGQAGASVGTYGQMNGAAGFNVATHVGDDATAVAHNRALLRQVLPNEPLWLNQTHGVHILRTLDAHCPEADAVLLTEPNQVGVIMTADCLPVLFTTRAGTVVAAAHAGWRSLVNGILEKTVAAMTQTGARPADILAWLGPAIGPRQFEVGAEVRQAFLDAAATNAMSMAATQACFVAQTNPQANPQTTPHANPQKYLADIYALARLRLQCAGVSAAHITGGHGCTVTDGEQFYSYRRNGSTGRMATLIGRVT